MPDRREPKPAARMPQPIEAASPWWGVVAVLGEIAKRVERQRSDEHTRMLPSEEAIEDKPTGRKEAT